MLWTHGQFCGCRRAVVVEECIEMNSDHADFLKIVHLPWPVLLHSTLPCCWDEVMGVILIKKELN
jgi:hypothetical protein